MKTDTYYMEATYKKSNPQRMQVIVWVSALFISFLTFFAPVFMKSTERYVMVAETAIKGYELIAYAPVTSIFILVAPIISAALYKAKLTMGKKVTAYNILHLAYAVACLVTVYSLIKEIILVENCMVVFHRLAWIVLLAFYLHLLLGLLPAAVLWIQNREE